jgi:hypothetical protein
MEKLRVRASERASVRERERERESIRAREMQTQGQVRHARDRNEREREQIFSQFAGVSIIGERRYAHEEAVRLTTQSSIGKSSSTLAK